MFRVEKERQYVKSENGKITYLEWKKKDISRMEKERKRKER